MTKNSFDTLLEKSNLLKRSDLVKLLQISMTMNSMLSKVINKQEKGEPSGAPSDLSDVLEVNSGDNSQSNEDKDDEEEKKSGSDLKTELRQTEITQKNPPLAKNTDRVKNLKAVETTHSSKLQSEQRVSLERVVPQDRILKMNEEKPEDNVDSDDSSDWEQIARKNQLMPKGDWRIWMLLAGRGFGKTRAAAEAVRKLALSGKYKRIALIANTIEEVKQVMVEGVSGLQNISKDEDGLVYTPSRREIRWKNGAIATLYGAENYQQLRGPQFDLAWVDEFAKFLYPRETFEQLSFALRMGDDPKLILTTTPRPIPFIKELIARDDVVTVRGSSLENEANLSPAFLKQLEYLKGTRMEAQEIFAEIVEDNPNTLWSWRDIENCYKDPPHFMENIIIGVDPATTSGENSDETGIIVVGKDCNDRAFVLEDATMHAAPEVWAKKVADLYKRYRARKVIIETNAGGDLLEQILLQNDFEMKIKKVRARESKVCRAQPVVLLYQKNLVFHSKQFRELEMQMATYEPGQKSPDRMDALVWALSDLFEIETSNYVPRAFLI